MDFCFCRRPSTLTRLSSVVTGLREVLGVPVHPWGGEYFSHGGQGTPLWSPRGGAEMAVWLSTEMPA